MTRTLLLADAGSVQVFGARVREQQCRDDADQRGLSRPVRAQDAEDLTPWNVERHVVSVNGEPITLPLKEFDLLEYLMRNSGRVLTRGQLIDRVWGADYVGDTKTLDVHVKRLRAKIEADPSTPTRITTIRGLGYKYETQSRRQAESADGRRAAAPDRE